MAFHGISLCYQRLFGFDQNGFGFWTHGYPKESGKNTPVEGEEVNAWMIGPTTVGFWTVRFGFSIALGFFCVISSCSDPDCQCFFFALSCCNASDRSCDLQSKTLTFPRFPAIQRMYKLPGPWTANKQSPQKGEMQKFALSSLISGSVALGIINTVIWSQYLQTCAHTMHSLASV